MNLVRDFLEEIRSSVDADTKSFEKDFEKHFKQFNPKEGQRNKAAWKKAKSETKSLKLKQN